MKIDKQRIEQRERKTVQDEMHIQRERRKGSGSNEGDMKTKERKTEKEM
jgi:hypothetical protein